MRTTTIVASALALAMTAPAPAHAGSDYYRSGYWKVYKTTIRHGTEVGSPTCGMHTDWDNNGASLHIKFVPETGVFMQVWNPAWKFGDNAKPVPVTIGFDRRPNYMSGDATPETAKLDRGSIGVLTTNLGGHQEKAEDRDRAVLDFLDNFADADDMWLDFGNNHIRWHAKMDGSRSAARVFLKCVRSILDEETPPPTESTPQAKADPTPTPAPTEKTVRTTVEHPKKDDGSI